MNKQDDDFYRLVRHDSSYSASSQKSEGMSREAIGVLIVMVISLIFIAAVISTTMKIVDVTSSLSPDDTKRIVVRQRRLITLDRNFRIVLIDEGTKEEREIFYSFDQSPSIREEHVVWSSDGRYFALIGDRYYVFPDSELPNGLTLFLVYDLETDQIYCNTDFEERGFSRMTADEAVELFGKEAFEAVTPVGNRD